MATVNIVDLDGNYKNLYLCSVCFHKLPCSLVALVVFNPIEYTVVEDPVVINFIVELVTPTERQLSITLNISAGSAQGASARLN